MAAAEITSLQNPQIKRAIHLRESRQRAKLGLILIEGRREFARALASGVVPDRLFYLASLGSELDEHLDAAERAGVELCPVSAPVYEKLAFGRRTEGLVAVAPTPSRRLDDLRLPPGPLVAVLEAVEKPGNVGAVLRSADAAGVSAVVLADPGTDLFNPQTIRASLGAVFTLPAATGPTSEVLAWLRSQNLQVYVARVDAERSYFECDLARGTALVLGSEAAGLSPLWQGDDLVPIGLPMLGQVDSLNVSAAAAALFYEALRQRQARV